MQIRNIILIWLMMTISISILNAEIIETIEWQEKDKSPVSIAIFTGKYKDYKIHDGETGMHYLKIDVEVEVKEKGDYIIFGQLEELWEDACLHLKKGIHEISLTFNGNRIYKEKYNTFNLTVALSILVAEDEVTDHNRHSIKRKRYASLDKKWLQLSQYDYKGFRQTPILIKDKAKTVIQIAEDLLKSGWYPGVTGVIPESIKEVPLLDFMGFDSESSIYKLYSGVICIIPAKRYVAISKDFSSAFSIWDTESFNDFISSLSLSLKDSKKIINLTKAFLKITSGPSEIRILWRIPPSIKGEKMTFEKWFNIHPEHKFHLPKVKKTKIGYSVEYYTWTEHIGILGHQYFELKQNGEIIKHKEEQLGERIGHYVVI